MKELERKFSKSDRIVARAKFSGWVFASEIVLAAVLGGLVAVLWIFAPQIEGFFTKSTEVAYLTEQNLKYAVAGCGAFVLIVFVMHVVSVYRKEVILTEDKLVIKSGVTGTFSAIVPIFEVKMVESNQNLVQRALGYGDINVISEAEKPYLIKNVVKPEKLARKIMKQVSSTRSTANNMRNVKLTLAAPSRAVGK